VNTLALPRRSPPVALASALILVLALLSLFAGCATPGPAPTPPGTGAPGSSGPVPAAPGSPSTRPPAPPPLVSEQRWLDEWFRGTPVVIALADIHTLAVDVPLAHSFDAGSSSIKPALAAVLDRVATSLRRQPAVRVSVATPTDASGGTVALAAARGQQVREHLLSRGVAATRLAGVGTARPGAPVQLRLLAPAQAIGRLDELPAPSAGIKPTAAGPAPVKR
jgi:outer membrane protein OmpA-like peptidoglycan-associated protein